MAVVVWTVLAIVVGYALYEWLDSKFGAPRKYPPSPLGIPIVGHAFQMLYTNYNTSTALSQQLGGKSYMMKLFGKYVLFLTTWTDMKEAAVNQADVFTDKMMPKSQSAEKLSNNTFLFLDGPVWKEKRRFTLHHLRNFGFGKKLMENTILEEFDRVSEVLDGEQRTMSFSNFFFCPFLNVLWGIVAGKTYEFGDDELKRIRDSIMYTFSSMKRAVILETFPWVKHLPGDPLGARENERNIRIVTDFIEKQIDEHLTTLGDGEPRDYMDAYLLEIKKREATTLTEDNACYKRSHLVGAIYDILQAGVETTATTLEWSLLYMATWPEIQKKVQDELDTVIGRDRRTTYSDNSMLPYIKAVLMEVQRYCSVVPICSPRITARETKLNDYVIPSGTAIILNIHAVHYEKAVWGDPEIFRPERFLGDDGKADKPDGWIPFSLGPRICLGESLARMELFLYFTGLLQKYSFRIITGDAPPSLVPVTGLSLKPQPFKLAIIKR